MTPEPVIPPHGGYRNLKSFQLAQLVYDLTARFCDSYIDRRSRTHDQMVQAARSGVQNIAEGSLASATLLLITVAISLLDRQLIAQAETFEKEGGFRERLYRIRQQARRNPKDTPGP